MGLFSFLHKNKQDATPGRAEYRSQSDEPFTSPRSRPKRTGNSSNSKETDPILPEKKRARRRLIGAVVLVLAVIIVLPMILDPEPHAVPDDIAIQIPSRDAKNAAAGSKAADTAGLDATEEIIEPTNGSGSVKASAADKADGNAANAVVGNAAAGGAPNNVVTSAPAAAAGIVAPAVKPTEKPAEKAPEKPAPAHVAEKLVEKAVVKPLATAAPGASAPTRHADPVAAPKKQELTEEERALAILQGKPVRVAGAAKSATAAQTDSKSSPADAKAHAKTSGKFIIQVAALATQEKVDELRSKLTAAGISSYTQKVATQGGDRTRIRVGPFANRSEADKARAHIDKLGLNATVIPN